MPQVFVVGSTSVDTESIDDYLEAIGASSHARHMIRQRELSINSSLDRLVEVMGRLCYKSWAPLLNPNVQKIREDAAQYLHNLIDSGHGSVLEHASINFIISGVSRVFTHELVRHRVGTAFSQESMRFVRLSADASIRDTPYLDAESRMVLEQRVRALMRTVEEIADRLALNDPKSSFELKKLLTSDLRSFVPMGVLTEIGFSANVRTLRWLIETRTSLGAEHEIREVFNLIAEKCVELSPHLFADFGKDLDNVWTPLKSKV